MRAQTAKEYHQHKDINFDETYAFGIRLEAIRIFLDFSSILNFKLFGMDVRVCSLRVTSKRKYILINLLDFKISLLLIMSSS